MAEETERIVEEGLPHPSLEQEAKQPEGETADRKLNVIIPSMVGQIAFGSAPSSALPPGIPPSAKSEQAQQYVNTTAPILDMMNFHECLGPMTYISPTARLIIGGVILIGGVVVMKLPQMKKQKEKKEQKEKRDAEDKPDDSRSPEGQ